MCLNGSGLSIDALTFDLKGTRVLCFGSGRHKRQADITLLFENILD